MLPAISNYLAFPKFAALIYYIYSKIEDIWSTGKGYSTFENIYMNNSGHRDIINQSQLCVCILKENSIKHYKMKMGFLVRLWVPNLTTSMV